MQSHAVLIAGAGPTGLMLAAELALAGVDVGVIEKRASQALAGTRAGGLQARTIEVFDMRGIAERFLQAGKAAQVAGFARVQLDISDFPMRHPHGLGLWQNEIERLLAEWVDTLGVRIHREREVIGLAQDAAGVDVQLSNGESMRAQYLVGCDGGRSVVRKQAGFDFPGFEPTTSSLIAQVEMAVEPELGIRRDANGMHALGKIDYDIVDGKVVYKPGGTVGVMLTEATIQRGEPTLDELRAALVGVYGTDFGVHSPTWISRFTDATRQAASYRDRRVLLAGDAAHIHAPDGGQGLNIGVQDAFNLGWKLARVVNGTAREALLDTYHAERHPAAARVLRMTMASVALRRPDDRTEALRETVADLLGMEEPRKRYGAMLSGLDLQYPLGEGHPLLGRRMPDLDIATANGKTRVYAQLQEAQPVLLDFAGITHAHDGIKRVECKHAGAWELPVIGRVDAPSAVLIRPDGHVAWVGMESDAGLREAIVRHLEGGA